MKKRKVNVTTFVYNGWGLKHTTDRQTKENNSPRKTFKVVAVILLAKIIINTA